MVVALDKDPQEVLDFTFDWAEELAAGETISSVTWTIPAALSQGSTSNTTTTTTFWSSAGVEDEYYTVYCKIVTNQSRTHRKRLVLRGKVG